MSALEQLQTSAVVFWLESKSNQTLSSLVLDENVHYAEARIVFLFHLELIRVQISSRPLQDHRADLLSGGNMFLPSITSLLRCAVPNSGAQL